MLTARSVVTATVATALLSIVLATVSLLGPLENGGMGSDSYGTRAHGYRALFEILEELKVPVRRRLEPPENGLDLEQTYVLWAPHQNLVDLEPAYLKSVARWVRQGGRVVVAPARVYVSGWEPMGPEHPGKEEETNILKELGLSDVAVHSIDQPDDPDEEDAGRVAEASTETPPPEYDHQDNALEDFESLREAVGEMFSPQVTPTRSVSIGAAGTLAYLQRYVVTVEVPESGLAIVDCGESETAGRVTFSDGDGTEHTLAAAYRLGGGEVVVVGDPRLLQNRLVARQDNSVLAAHLIAADGRGVLFDEFYHGLTIRGNPLWLFTRRGYGAVTVCFVIGMGLWIWQQSVFLGPPLASTGEDRRSIGEYVEAMARFLTLGRTSRRFVLREVRDGVLRTVRSELGLPPGREGPEDLLALLERRDPRRAKLLTTGVAKVDRLLLNQARCSEKETVQALQRISACVSSHDIRPFGRRSGK